MSAQRLGVCDWGWTMAPTYVGPLSHAFRYVTVDMLRAEGIGAYILPDDRAADMILLVSNWINWLT